MQLSYDRYLDQILGGWIGKSMGGAIGARFEGYKGWTELRPEEMFPPSMPPNDDLDLQVLWLKVLEEKGPALTSDDLAAAWLEGCWYPFNEYGIFRRNWRLGIHPPYTGSFTNQFWETGEGCPIRAEVWGYVFPGAPDLAAKYAEKDGVLDHTGQSVGAEKMLAAMASMAFFVPDVRRLASMFSHYLPEGTPIQKLTQAAFQCYDEGLSLRDARDRLMALAGIPEACDSQINIPFTFLGLLYGGNDLTKVMLSALACGYDTDCTLASAAALVGQIIGARRIPQALKAPVGDELVMGIQYRRPEMTLSALARDTARVGVLMAKALETGITISGAPELRPFPGAAQIPAARVRVEYTGFPGKPALPCAAPGEPVPVTVCIDGKIPAGARLRMLVPEGWRAEPAACPVNEFQSRYPVTLHPPTAPEEWPMLNLFQAQVDGSEYDHSAWPAGQSTALPRHTGGLPKPTGALEQAFGVAGAGLWRFLGVYYDALPDAENEVQQRRRFNQHYVSLERAYLPEPDVDVAGLYADWSRKLGRPALVPSYEHEVDPGRLIGLRGPYCAYLARTIISPREREVYLVIGNNDAYRLYLNGACVSEMDETVWWAPFNNVVKVTLQKGENLLLLKLIKRGDELRFTFGVRKNTGHPGGFNCEDWMVDLVDKG
ncbi:MAG: ADP-ribosylglycohydrolase family protein [Chloroflexi bacterium]|nr:MAG: ADP-ribosylglycohydrolase family protein [Chloroflexota bacterium]